jgi:hypothetical protein
MVKEHVNVVDIVQIWIVVFRRQVPDPGGINAEQKDLSDVDLPGAPQDPRAPYHRAAVKHNPRVNKRRCKSRDEDEQVGSVTKPVIYGRNPIEYIVGNVIDKNLPVCKSTKQVESQISTLRRKYRGHQMHSRPDLLVIERLQTGRRFHQIFLHGVWLTGSPTTLSQPA